VESSPAAITASAGSSDSLQFEKAEFAQAAPGKVTCAACKQSIPDSYFHVNRVVVCAPCKEKIQTSGVGRLSFKGFGMSVVCGVAAALLGALVWYAVRELTGYELGLLGIGLGLLVGIAVRIGSRGWGGWQYQLLAMVLTYSAIASSYVPPILQELNARREKSARHASQTSTSSTAATSPAKENPAPSDDAAANADTVDHAGAKSDTSSPISGLPKPVRLVIRYVLVFVLACAVPLFGGFMGWIIIGIALYEAWKINRRVPLEITGPYRIAEAPAET
jgi:hypothetical protein